MDLTCDERPSDSPFVERAWRRQGESSASSFISMAETHWVMVATKHRDKTILTVHGPETKATPAYALADAEYFGIMFKPGTFLTILPARSVRYHVYVRSFAGASDLSNLCCRIWAPELGVAKRQVRGNDGSDHEYIVLTSTSIDNSSHSGSRIERNTAGFASGIEARSIEGNLS